MNYDLWNAELKNPVPESDRLERSVDPLMMSGFWRIEAAKTKADYPVAIWTGEGQTATMFKIGLKLMNTEQNADKWQEFLDQTWPLCHAVSTPAYHAAMASGFWADGKPARKMSDEEKLGIDVKPGDNQAPVEEALADQIAALVEKADATPEPQTQEQANAATGILDKLRTLLKRAETERVAEKEPHLEAGRAVDAKWALVADPGKRAGVALDERRKSYLRKEQARLDALAAEETRKREEAARAERQRLADEENARRAAEAAEQGDAPAELVKPEDIAVPEVAPVEAQRATAGTEFGRASGLKKVKVAVIEDKAKLLAALADDDDMLAYLQSRADKAMKAKITLPGVKIEEVLK